MTEEKSSEVLRKLGDNAKLAINVATLACNLIEACQIHTRSVFLLCNVKPVTI